MDKKKSLMCYDDLSIQDQEDGTKVIKNGMVMDKETAEKKGE